MEVQLQPMIIYYINLIIN